MPTVAAKPTTPGLGLPIAPVAQGIEGQNDLLLDALLHLSAKSATTTAAPAYPAVGDAYIVPASGTGAFAGQTNNVALCQPQSIKDGVPSAAVKWVFLAPKLGMTAFCQDTGLEFAWSGTAWGVKGSGGIQGPLTAPANSSAAGKAGQCYFDASGLLYICIATNTWRKFTGATF